VAVSNLPYTYVVPKNGKEYWRFRKGKLHTALPGKPGDAEFHAKYGELLALGEDKQPKAIEGSMKALIDAYRKSAEYGALRPPTQLDYGKTLDLIETQMGDEPYRFITTAMVKLIRDKYRKTPRKAHKIKQMVSRLYSWAQEESLVKAGLNPAASFKKLKVRVKPIIPWSEEEIALFLANCPTHLKTVVLLALCTGQRAEDVVKMEWPAFQGAIVRVLQSKTGEPLMIGCHRDLRKHLASVKTAFSGRIARAASGRPYTANGFAKAVSDCGAKIPGWPGNRSPHGLRYAAAGRLEEAGVTPADASSVLGHRTYQMAMKYLSQRKRSEAANRKVEDNA
jgi:integrase